MLLCSIPARSQGRHNNPTEVKTATWWNGKTSISCTFCISLSPSVIAVAAFLLAPMNSSPVRKTKESHYLPSAETPIMCNLIDVRLKFLLHQETKIQLECWQKTSTRKRGTNTIHLEHPILITRQWDYNKVKIQLNALYRPGRRLRRWSNSLWIAARNSTPAAVVFPSTIHNLACDINAASDGTKHLSYIHTLIPCQFQITNGCWCQDGQHW